MHDYIEISAHYLSSDAELFAGIVNQGIDARLTGFTKSTFARTNTRLHFSFHKSELEILMRRLDKIAERNKSADSWLNDLLCHCYGVEVV